jgi:hypothetical protein
MSPILDILFGRSWFIKVDKKLLCDICGVTRISIKENEEVSSKTLGEAYDYVDAKTEKGLFIATKYRTNMAKGMKNAIVSGQEGLQPKFIQADIMPEIDSLYYEIGDKQKNILMIRNDAIDLLTTKLSKNQLMEIAHHFADKKIV